MTAETKQMLARAWRGALAATLVYGAWGFANNLGHGVATALRVGVGQGLFSGAATLVLSALLERLFAAMRGRRAQTIALGVCGLHGTALAVHLALRTPEILRTMGLGLVVGTTYIALYVRRLGRDEARAAAPAGARVVSAR